MLGYIVRRLGQSVVILLGVTLAAFFLYHLLPGGPVRALLGNRASSLAVRTFMRQNGYDNSLFVQYLDYLGRLLHGNLGYSFKDNQSVDSILGNDIPKSVILIGSSIVVALVLGIGAGLFQAIHRNRADDHVLTAVAFFLYAMPDFFLALVLIDVFAIRLHWVPPIARPDRAGRRRSPIPSP